MAVSAPSTPEETARKPGPAFLSGNCFALFSCVAAILQEHLHAKKTFVYPELLFLLIS